MKIWKQNQKLYHLLTTDFSDDMSKMNVKYDYEDLVGAALKFFHDPEDLMVYPGKAYAVAVIYAKLLVDNFEEDFYEVLDDPLLMFGNDYNFVTYSEGQVVYDALIEALGGVDNIPLTGKWVDYTVKYFKEEFMCESECFNV